MSHITNATLAITTETPHDQRTRDRGEAPVQRPQDHASTEAAPALDPGRLHAGDTNEGHGPAQGHGHGPEHTSMFTSTSPSNRVPVRQPEGHLGGAAHTPCHRCHRSVCLLGERVPMTIIRHRRSVEMTRSTIPSVRARCNSSPTPGPIPYHELTNEKLPGTTTSCLGAPWSPRYIPQRRRRQSLTSRPS